MSEDKPLHVRVAEALGWSVYYSKHDYWIITEPDGTRHEDGYGLPHPKYDSETGKRLRMREWWEEYDPPRYDTDWSATGRLIEQYTERLDLMPRGLWEAYGKGENGVGETMLLAVCHLILALAAAGKLEAA